MSKTLLLPLIFFFAVVSGHAQQTEIVISGNYNGYSLKKFIEEVEKQTPLRFYYRPSWIDSVTINTAYYQGELSVFLANILKETNLKFAISNDNKVFITKERSVSTSLANGFFLNEKKQQSAPANFDFSEYETRGAKLKSQEEKLFTIGAGGGNLSGPVSISGYILNLLSGEPVIGATIYVENLSTGVTTDASGFYSLTLPRGRHSWKIESLGMKTTKRQIMVNGPGKFTIEMDEMITPLKEVVIESDRDARVASVEMGVERLDIKTMKQMPSVLGETDVLKIILTLPGVQTVGEGASGVNVRGGTTNQNLILYNDAVVYNPSHVFGFFSAFNPDVLKNVELYKSGITAEYGGRLSSVMDISSREGNLKKLSVSGGISPITGRLMAEGPIVKDKTSFLFGVRSTYSNWLLRQLKSEPLKNSQASFYDINFNINHKMDDRNSFHFSSYLSSDRFTLNSDTLYSYSDRNASLKWKHVFNNKLYGIFTGSYSRYQYDISADKNPTNAFVMGFGVQQVNGKADFSYFRNLQQTFTAGIQVTRYGLSPGRLQPEGHESIVIADKIQNEQAVESALYIGEHFDVTPKLTLYGGLRYSLYHYLGPGRVFSYADGITRSENSITDTTSFSAGKAIASYHGAEPRFSVRYLMGKKSSIKISFTRMRQYIQMLSNTTAIAPTDIWKLSDSYIRPQVADQYALGYYRNLKGGSVEFSAEAYYKVMQNSLDFKEGALLMMNHHIETDALNVHGKAYGLEFMIRKPAGKLNGWISYTYSRSLLQTRTTQSAERINNGEYYPSNYDKPHAANFIGNYKFSRRFNFSLNMTYSTGRPITVPIAKYQQNGNTYLYYSDRNEFRIPDYFRTDVSVNIEGNHRIKKLAHSSWTLAIYNVTSRSNAYSVYFVSEGEQIKGYKLSVFARAIPTITYNFKF